MPRAVTLVLLLALLVVGGWFVVAAGTEAIHLLSYGPTFRPTPAVKREIAWYFAIGVTLLVCSSVVYATLLRRRPGPPRGFDVDPPARGGGTGAAP